MRVLAFNPEHGVAIPGYGQLRKMRVHVKALRTGKSNGYRCIYRKLRIDEVDHVVFLDIYFKGDVTDLTSQQYALLTIEADQILSDSLSFDWSDPPR